MIALTSLALLLLVVANGFMYVEVMEEIAGNPASGRSRRLSGRLSVHPLSPPSPDGWAARSNARGLFL